MPTASSTSSSAPDGPLTTLPDPALVVLVGAAGSGRSTGAAACYRPSEVVSSAGGIPRHGSGVLDVAVVGTSRDDTAARVERRRGRTTAATYAARHRAGEAAAHSERYHRAGRPRPLRPARPGLAMSLTRRGVHR